MRNHPGICPGKTRKPSPSEVLINLVRPLLQESGRVQTPAEPWLSAASVYLRAHSRSRSPKPHETPAAWVEGTIWSLGWNCSWVGEDIVIEVPEWDPSLSRTVAIQGRLFD
jgi:hypothetical protein